MTQENASPPPLPEDWHNAGWQHYLIGKHTPDRMATSTYPTQDRCAPEDEAEFIAGWNAAKAADDLLEFEQNQQD